MNGISSQLFTVYRVHSVTRPKLGVGLLQGSNSLSGPWEDIKPIVPLPGENPRDLLDEEDDDRGVNACVAEATEARWIA